MRIVTRPDFDGVVCAVLLRDVLKIDTPVKWIEPYELKHRKSEIIKGDIIANLPYVKSCTLWFDHHLSNKSNVKFDGSFKIAPSAAGVIFEYYNNKFSGDFKDLVFETDRIDSANVTIDEVLSPEKYPYMLLASTISGSSKEDEEYWNWVVKLLIEKSMDQVMNDSWVQDRSAIVIEQNRTFSTALKEHTKVTEKIAITDFLSLEKEPKGNRFLVYSLFPEILVDVRVRYNKNDRGQVVVSLGQNLFNRKNVINLGELAAIYGGGGHYGAGACSFPVIEAEKNIHDIITILKNQ